MPCTYSNSNVRSVQTAYNNAQQALTTTTPTTVVILGTQVCDTGCSIDTVTNGFKILHTGIYRFSFDVVITATTAGTAEIQLINGTTALPCADVSQYVDTTGASAVHVETSIEVPVCRMVRPVISAAVSGIAGAITHVCATAEKLA